MTVALGAFVVNGLAALILRERDPDLNMRAAALHMGGDAVGSLAVSRRRGAARGQPLAPWFADPIASLVVAP